MASWLSFPLVHVGFNPGSTGSYPCYPGQVNVNQQTFILSTEMKISMGNKKIVPHQVEGTGKDKSICNKGDTAECYSHFVFHPGLRSLIWKVSGMNQCRGWQTYKEPGTKYFN